MQNILIKPLQAQKTNDASCHGGPNVDTTGLPLIAIVGSPNVGKSVLFNTLTGAYVTVSNYPGTTVELSRGKGRLAGRPVGVVDTPGMYRLVPMTEEERVARDILLRERPDITLHVVDAKNLERMLPMTLQLIEAGQPVILVCNLMDEFEQMGMKIDTIALEQALGIQVIPTALAMGRGAAHLKEVVSSSLNRHGRPSDVCTNCDPTHAQDALVQYPPVIADALHQLEGQLYGSYQLTKRTIALLLLQNDTEVATLVSAQEGARYEDIKAIVRSTQDRFSQPLSFVIARYQREVTSRILQNVLVQPERRVSNFAEKLSAAMMNPLTGIPILLFSLYVLYQFVGAFGAQTLVDFLEDTVFGGAYQSLDRWFAHELCAMAGHP